jgi:hypothetical protein
MSRHLAFRRQPVDPQVAQNLRVLALPSPTRGIVQSENEAFMQPGGAIVCDNWAPTLRGVKLRGGYIRHCDLHALDATVPPVPDPLRKPVISAFEYVSAGSQKMFAAQQTKLFDVTATTPILVKSGQTSGNYAATQMNNAGATPLGNNWLIAVNETGDYPLRFKGDTETWVTLDPTTGSTTWANSTVYALNAVAKDPVDNSYWKATSAHTSAATGTFAAARTATPGLWVSTAASDGASFITGPVDSAVKDGHNLGYVWKYRNRLMFIETGSMNAWYLAPNAVGGVLQLIPLGGSAAKGGKLMFGASWSMDAGDGLDEKCIFVTDLGEVLVFTGTNPADAANWRQQGRYDLSPPLGMNAHMQLGGDVLIATEAGLIPLSQAINKEAGQLELAMLTRPIKRLWRENVVAKRASPWTMKRWDSYAAFFVATPGGLPGARTCLLANNTSIAWARYDWDATCWLLLRDDLYFGTQDGIVMLANRTGYDDGEDKKIPYIATLVGGWETFGPPANQVVWHQARAAFVASTGREAFYPQLAATVDYVVKLPQPPAAGADLGVMDVWDQGLWYAPDPPLPAVPPSPADIATYAQWDQPSAAQPPIRNTMWISIGKTGFAHAPIVQVTVAQQAVPTVELIAISATYEPAGVNV